MQEFLERVDEMESALAEDQEKLFANINGQASECCGSFRPF